MANNVAITAGSGTSIATDEVVDGTLGTVQVQYVKLMDGTDDGTTRGVIGARGLAVDIAAAAAAIAKAEDAASANADVGVPAMAVQKATPANTAGTDGDYEFLQMSAGRLWVDASGKTLTVDGSGVTQPVSGTFWQATQPVSGTVTATIAAGATTIAKAEDVASADADVGVPSMAVRKAAPANTSGTDGDYEFLQMSAGRLWASVVVDTALPAGTNAIGKLAANSGVDIGDIDVTSIVPGTGATNLGKAEDGAHSSGDTGVMALAVRTDAPTNRSGTDGDYEPLQMSSGRLWTNAKPEGDEYETVAASQTAQTLGATGATGDYIAGVLVVPATTSPGNVIILDNATSITIFTGGASSVSNLVPFMIPLGMTSVSGAWKLTTGANVSCIGIGQFT